MRRQGRESAAANLIPGKDYPKTGYFAAFELSVLSDNERKAAQMPIEASAMRYLHVIEEHFLWGARMANDAAQPIYGGHGRNQKFRFSR